MPSILNRKDLTTGVLLLLSVWIAGPLLVVLILSITSATISATSRAQIWMMTAALILWSTFSLLTLHLCQNIGVFAKPKPKSAPGRCIAFVILATILALIEEAFTQFMTEHAQFFSVSPGQAYITPSLCYWDTVLHHSVVVFVPMFAMCALLTERWLFSPKEIFFLFGLTGLAAEITMNPASLFMGFWLLVYGFMVLPPALWLHCENRSRDRNYRHYLSSIALMLLAGTFSSLLIHCIFPHHPDNHFIQTKSLSRLDFGK